MARTPSIRFDGFTDDWEQRKLSEVVDVLDGDRGKNYPTANDFDISGHTLFLNASNVTTDGFLFEDNQFISEEKSNSMGNGKLQMDDIVVTSRGSLGHIAWYNTDIMGIVPYARINSGMLILRDKSKINTPYLYQFMKSHKGQDQIFFMSFGSAQPQLTKKGVEELLVLSPKSTDEQMRIADFFCNLDNLITLHQRKCNILTQTKKYMLKKMFPKNGEKKPEIRFDGFTDDWKQRKFSDFTWNAGKRNSQNLDLEPYAVTNDRGFIRQNEAHDEFGYMKDVDRKAYNIVRPNSFAYNPARINVGSIGYYKGTEDVIVSSLYEVFQTADYVDDRFLWHWFKSDIFPKWIERLQEGSVRLYFYYDKLCECKMLMPSLPEQKKIAATLNEIDNLITLHQRKCESLKTIKKFMLKNMFS